MCSILGTTSKTISKEELKPYFDRTIPRGPDMSRLIETPLGYLGFHRLAIMGLHPEGMQPFELGQNKAVCNGEIYGFRKFKKELREKGYSFVSESDCEVILPLYKEYGMGMFPMLGSEFAVIVYDGEKNKVIAGRDPMGIRPLFYGYDESGAIMFGSEACNLEGLCKEVRPFPPGYFYDDGEFVRFENLTDVPGEKYVTDDVETACKGIHDRFMKSVEDRLDSDAPLGFLLSGGLDSSLVCAISQRLINEEAKRTGEPAKKIRTFAIGMEKDAIDLKYAKEVADFIGSEHTEVFMTPQQVIEELPNVIKLLGTWDITTIRASMGMYLCCKAIHETTDIRVLMTGEISDELFGYKYTDFAPDAEAFQKEAKKRVDELYMYDVLRADRCISANSLEARVPFGDVSFVKYVMSIDPKIKMNTYDMGKYLLRHAFEKDNLLPENILWRQKAAFSDAVGHSMVDDLKAYAEDRYTDEEFETLRQKYTYCTPFTKESLLYREIFEEFYPGQAEMIKDFWMPNKIWENCDVND
ncbi:MAG: asparagine synthase B, partial [Lachnospiraceae bacterium]|nr:asparagine synthase B [Lachnospiraceae bacterium]